MYYARLIKLESAANETAADRIIAVKSGVVSRENTYDIYTYAETTYQI